MLTPTARRRLAAPAVLTAILVPLTLLHDPRPGSADRRPERVGASVLVGAAVPPVLPVAGPQAAAFDAFDDVLGHRAALVHLFRAPGEPLVPPGLDELTADRTVLLSWNVVDLAGVAAGLHDDAVRADATALRDTGARVLLRVRWEMDRPNLREVVRSPATYVAAWRRLRQLFAEVGAEAGWVWCPTAEGFGPGGDAAAFYPGDDQVDWLCADAYPGKELTPLGELLGPFLDWASARPLPVMVGEFGVPRTADDATRAAWLDDATAFLAARPAIAAVVYFALDVVPEAPVLQFGIDPGTRAAAALGRMVDVLQEEV